MAGQRMLSASICTNQRLARCSIDSGLGWALAMTKTDRQGRLPGDPFTLLSLCWPAWAFAHGWSEAKAAAITEELSAAGLWIPYTCAGTGQAVVQVHRFFDHQTIRFDRERRPSKWCNGYGDPDPGEADRWYERLAGVSREAPRGHAEPSVGLSDRDARHPVPDAGNVPGIAPQMPGLGVLTELNGTEPNRTEPNRGDVRRARAREGRPTAPTRGPLADAVAAALAPGGTAPRAPVIPPDPTLDAQRAASRALSLVEPGEEAHPTLSAAVAGFLRVPASHEDVQAAVDEWARDRWTLNAALVVCARASKPEIRDAIANPRAYLAKAVFAQVPELKARFATEIDKALDVADRGAPVRVPEYDPRR